MRALAYGLLVGGLGALGYGVYRVAGAAGDGVYGNQLGGYTTGASFGVIALALLLAARRLWGQAPGKVRDGVAGFGDVLSVRDTGITTNTTVMHVEATVTASAPGIGPYPAKVRIKLGRAQWGAIQPGMRVPILIDPTDHAKVAYDYDRPAAPAAGTGPLGGAQVVTRSAGDVIARGVPVMGTLFSAQASGITAGQAASGLSPDAADDPLVAVSFGYPGPDGEQRTMNALVRVPDGKQLHAGQPVPVSYLPEQPDTATIDWTRL